MGATKRKITKDVFYKVKAATKEPSNRERVMKDYDISATTYRAIKNQCRTYEDYLVVTAGWRKRPVHSDKLDELQIRKQEAELRQQKNTDTAACILFAAIIAFVLLAIYAFGKWVLS